jgi:hypothetical protein
MKQIFTFLVVILLTANTYAQVVIGTINPDGSAALDITSTTKGLLPPRMTTGERNLITSAAKGLIVFNTTLNTLQINEGDATTVNWVSLSSTSATYSIGDVVNGGVVFWLDSTGQHGLVVALSDVATSVKWGCFNTDLPNVPNVTYNGGVAVGLGAEIGDGFNNTNDILQDCPAAPAALAARSLGAQWFLPSAKELNQMYINKTTLEAVSGFTAFAHGFYWSSTQDDDIIAWAQNFGNGTQNDNYKDDRSNVRAVRAF